MKTTVTSYQFVEAFRACGRETQFSRAALFALFDYLESYEDDCGVEIELDPIALCCEWEEFKNSIDACADFLESFEDEDKAFEWLCNQTQVILFEGGILVQNF